MDQTVLAIAMIVLGGLVTVFGATRLLASRRALAPNEVGPTQGRAFVIMVAGDVLLVAGILLLLL